MTEILWCVTYLHLYKSIIKQRHFHNNEMKGKLTKFSLKCFTTFYRYPIYIYWHNNEMKGKYIHGLS